MHPLSSTATSTLKTAATTLLMSISPFFFLLDAFATTKMPHHGIHPRRFRHGGEGAPTL
jgi:hypothetical protein